MPVIRCSSIDEKGSTCPTDDDGRSASGASPSPVSEPRLRFVRPHSFLTAKLNANDIEDAMERACWEREAKFSFLGVVDWNAKSVTHVLRCFDKTVSRKTFLPTTPVATIVNVGDHWCAIWVDRRTKLITYFDPFGAPPPNISCDDLVPTPIPNGLWTQHSRVSATPNGLLTREILEQLHHRIGSPYCIRYSTIPMQHDTYQCGMYSIWWLLRQVEFVPPGTDTAADMDRYRRNWFSITS